MTLPPILIGWCPDWRADLAGTLGHAQLRALRGESPVHMDELFPLLRELWSVWTQEFWNSTQEPAPRDDLRVLGHLCGADDLIQGLQSDSAVTVMRWTRDLSLLDDTPEDDNRAATLCVALVSALSQVPADILTHPALQRALLNPASSAAVADLTGTAEGTVILLSGLVTTLLRGNFEAAQDTFALLNRVGRDWQDQLPTALLRARQLAREAVSLEEDERLPCGPGPLIASALLSPDASALRAQLARVCSPRLRRALAAASWRSGTYDRSRHPLISVRDLLRGDQAHSDETTPPELILAALQQDAPPEQASTEAPRDGQAPVTLPRALARLAIAAIHTWGAATPNLPVQSARPAQPSSEFPLPNEPLLGMDGMNVSWEHDLALPSLSLDDERPELADTHLLTKFAALPVVVPGPGEVDYSATLLKVTALMAMTAKVPFSLPRRERALNLLSGADLALPHHSDPLVQATLQAILTHPRSDSNDLYWARKALEATETT